MMPLRFGAGGQLLMLALHGRPKGGLRAPFGFSIFLLLVLPSKLGYQDSAGLIAGQPARPERSQKAALVSPFGTIHEQRLSVPQPVGATIPLSSGYTLVGFDPNGGESTGAILGHARGERANRPYGETMVDRSRKGDFAVSHKGDRLIAMKGENSRLPPQPQALQGPSDDERSRVVQRAVAPARESVERRALAPVAPSLAGATAEPVEESARPATEIRGYSLASGGEYRVANVSPQNSKTAYPVLAQPRQDGGSTARRTVGEPGDRPAASLATIEIDQALRASRIYFNVDPMG